MNEEGAGGGIGGGTIDPGALLLAMGGHQEAREYLRKQTRLVDLQIGDMERENKLRHWSLRFGNLSAVMKVAFEVALAFIFLALAAGIAGAIWTAAHDDSLVIDAFSVPPDMANRGLTGQAVAAQLEDRLEAMQDATDTARPASSYSNNWGDDIKVQIPDTGVSISEFYRILTGWLGHQTHITGEVFRTPAGIAITARARGAGSATVYGSDEKLPALIQHTAEALYSMTQPYRYGIYLEAHGPAADPGAIFRRLAVEGTTETERAWAYNGIATLDTIRSADLYAGVADYHRVVAIKPDFALAWFNIGEYETTLGHDEAAQEAYRRALSLVASNLNIDMTARAAGVLMPTARAAIASELGDFQSARRELEDVSAKPDYSNTVEQAQEDFIVTLAQMHDGQNAQKAFVSLPSAKDKLLRATRTAVGLWAASSLDDWATTLRLEPEVERAFQDAGLNSGLDGNSLIVLRARRVWPAAAYASARMGDFDAAHVLIEKTPLDCYLCLRTRGKIFAAERKWDAAALWFARAVRQAPSLPLAYTEWGAMLLARGDVDGAIAKFDEAQVKGPHFADPLELWGEALMAKNRSDIAVAKFEEANKYAPNWGRLHLKWGEALMYAGRKDEAGKQFANASGLDLSIEDRAALSNRKTHHR